mgnify:CR=1 FL=1
MKTVSKEQFETHVAQFSTTIEEERDREFTYDIYIDAAGRQVGFVSYNAWRDPEYCINEWQFGVSGGALNDDVFETSDEAIEAAADRARQTGEAMIISDRATAMTRRVGPDGSLSAWS